MFNFVNVFLSRLNEQLKSFAKSMYTPTEAEVRENFPHAADCPADRSLDKLTEPADLGITFLDPPVVYLPNLKREVQRIVVSGSGSSMWSGPIAVDSQHLICKHCDADVIYR